MFDVEIRIIPAIVDNPPQFQNQLSVFSVSERVSDGAVIGTIQVTDDMGKALASLLLH